MTVIKTSVLRSATRGFAVGAMMVSGLALAACETARDPEVLRNPNYSTGYSDGCQSGQSEVAGFRDSVTRNRVLAEAEPAYDIGWRDGYAACGSGEFDSSDGSTREVFRRSSEHYETAPH